ncbi:MAG: EI24 domain-containing protein, partial [Alphaproteobacteria bacterium]
MTGTPLSAFITALGDLTHPRVRRVIRHTLLWTLAVFLGLGGLLGWGIASLDLALESLSGFWLDTLALWVIKLVAVAVAGFALVALVWLLFVAVVQLVAGFYLDEVVDAVEARRYPGLPRAASPSLTTAAAASLRLVGLMVLLNA